jgi:hypothetical protein
MIQAKAPQEHRAVLFSHLKVLFVIILPVRINMRLLFPSRKHNNFIGRKNGKEPDHAGTIG